MSDKVYNVLGLCSSNSARALPAVSLDRLSLKSKLDKIGKTV